jgi:release factor glutamine methyltransferase
MTHFGAGPPQDDASRREDSCIPHDLLSDIARRLSDMGYHFTTVTPETHRRFLQHREDVLASTLRDVWGWNMPFATGLLEPEVHTALQEAGLIVPEGNRWRSRIRFSSLGNAAYLHSGYPTQESDAVFFGPDTYRFVNLVLRYLERHASPIKRVLDVGCGGGAGGLMAAKTVADRGAPSPVVELVDINARALAMAGVNAQSLGVADVAYRRADLYAGTRPGLDLVVANPPYLVDADERLYRHGGGELGFDLALRIVAEGVSLLAPGGALVLYTGSPIVGGRDLFREAVEPWTHADGIAAKYHEIDPDVFGEELERPAYRNVERIAAVGLVVRRVASCGGP